VKVVCLSGGVGGAKLAAGLQDALAPDELTVIGNVGDDVEVLGLHISPDLDSILYALAGLADGERGWGRADESWRTLESVKEWGGESWFMLGDLDLGLHLGLRARLIPATDDDLRTRVATAAGAFFFQEWFVARRHEDEVDEVGFEGADGARPAAGVLEAIREADVLIVAPSNPYVSVGPILAVAAIRDALTARRVRCIAVSPLIGGRAIKGPVDRMLTRMAGGTTPAHVAGCYAGLIDALVIDRTDAPAEAEVELIVTETLMTDRAGRRRLAEKVLEAAA
jgi:LPPG:FO 2-phospho-L-lactate transferase